MAKGSAVVVQSTEAAAIVGYDPSQFQWETVKEESPDQIVLEVVGDTYIGELLRVLWINAETDPGKPEKMFLQAQFRDPDGVRAINCGYELTEAFRDAPVNLIYRIELKKYVDVDEASPMKSYQVDSAKVRHIADNQAAA